MTFFAKHKTIPRFSHIKILSHEIAVASSELAVATRETAVVAPCIQLSLSRLTYCICVY